MTTLADFLCPYDAGAFLSDDFGRRPVHISRSGHPRPDILDWPRFNEALAATSFWTEDSLKLYFKSRAALRESYCDPVDTRGRSAPVNPAKVQALIALGASVVANHIHRVRPEIAAVAHMLEKAFAARAFANVYCSFVGVQAFQTHYDLHDVFAFQAEGEKVWRVYESRADSPVFPVPPGDEAEAWLIETRGRVLFEAHMKPGDVLYLPRGQYHDALTGSQASLHVTFGVAPATGLALFKLLETVAARESAFRSYLPDARNQGALRERLAALASRVRALLTSPAFAIDVYNLQQGLATPRPDYALPRRAPQAWYTVAGKAQFVRRDHGFAVILETGEIPVGALHPTVEWLLQQRRFSFAEAAARQPYVPAAELEGVLQRLVAAGVLIETEMV